MFDNLRSSGHSIFTRILLMFIVLSFCLWGIGDIFRHGLGTGEVAKVGKLVVSQQEYQRALHNRQEDFRARLGKAYSAELAKKLGVERIALESVVNRLLLEQEAAAQGIVVGEDSIVDAVARSPEFHDANGQFSKEIYLEVLRANRRTEKDYIQSMQRQLATRLLMGTIASDVAVPENLVKALYRARQEKRNAGLLVLAPVAKPEGTPAEKDVKAYYDAHLSQYKVPEYRAVSYVELTPETVQKEAVSDAQVQKAYEERVEEFRMPERRTIDQLVFEKKEDAGKAEAAIAAGKTLEELAKTMPVLNKDKLRLGDMTRDSIPVAADEVFALKQGGVSKPEQSPFGWHIMRVSAILPAGVRPLEEVRDRLVKDLQLSAAQDVMAKLASTFEDAMGGGASLEDAAQKAGQKIHAIPSLARDGADEAGHRVALPVYSNFKDVAFSLAEKDHSRMMQGENGGYFMVRVDSIKPEHARPLDEVRTLVVDAVRKEQADSELRAKADQIAKDLKAGKKLEEAVAGKQVQPVWEPSGALLATTEKVEEGKLKGRTLPQALVQALFTLQPQGTTDAFALPEGGYVIGQLQHIERVTSTPDEAALKPLREELERNLTQSLQGDYLHYLRTKYPVTVERSFTTVSQDEGME